MTPQTLDCRGLKCPLPIIQTRLKLNELKKDDILIVQGDDPAFDADFARFCFLADIKQIERVEHPDFIEYRIQLTR